MEFFHDDYKEFYRVVEAQVVHHLRYQTTDTPSMRLRLIFHTDSSSNSNSNNYLHLHRCLLDRATQQDITRIVNNLIIIINLLSNTSQILCLTTQKHHCRFQIRLQ